MTIDVSQKGLGFFPGKVDERDWRLGAFLAPKIEKGQVQWYSPPPRLDQGKEGACVGFGHTNKYNSSPGIHHRTNEEAFALYKRAQREFDEWPGEDYEGTSVRAGAKAAVAEGMVKAYAFTYDVDEMAVAILNDGPVVIGVNWRTGADHPDKPHGYYIDPLSGRVRGGHCAEIDGVRFYGRPDTDWFRLRNSWGPSWGKDGACYIHYNDMKKWIAEQGAVVCTSVEI